MINIDCLNDYHLFIIGLLALGSFNIARHIHISYFQNKISFVSSQALIKSLLVIIGMTLMPYHSYFILNMRMECLGIVWGIIFGLFVIYCEVILTRLINRKKLYASLTKTKNKDQYDLTVISNTLTFSSEKKLMGLKQIRKNYIRFAREFNFGQFSLIAIIIIAIAEEFLFRGVIFSIAWQMENNIVMTLIIFLSGLLFACSHLSHSWNEVLVKLPLAIFTSLGFIFTQTLLSAVIIHVMLNTYAYQQQKRIKS